MSRKFKVVIGKYTSVKGRLGVSPKTWIRRAKYQVHVCGAGPSGSDVRIDKTFTRRRDAEKKARSVARLLQQKGHRVSLLLKARPSEKTCSR
jgi:hypothetical protein